MNIFFNRPVHRRPPSTYGELRVGDALRTSVGNRTVKAIWRTAGALHLVTNDGRMVVAQADLPVP